MNEKKWNFSTHHTPDEFWLLFKMSTTFLLVIWGLVSFYDLLCAMENCLSVTPGDKLPEAVGSKHAKRLESIPRSPPSSVSDVSRKEMPEKRHALVDFSRAECC